MTRRETKPINIGGVAVGVGAPIAVEAGTRAAADRIQRAIQQVRALRERGCEIVRVPVGTATADTVGTLRLEVAGALTADAGSDPRLGITGLLGRLDGVRIRLTPETRDDSLAELVRHARERRAPIALRVETGSGEPWMAAVERAAADVRRLESLNFDLILVSLQAGDVSGTVEANRALAERIPYPIQIALAEATPPVGTIRAAVAAGNLLDLGIGDSLEVALRGVDPTYHVDAAYEVLKSLGRREHGPILISCPTCGRLEIDLVGLAHAVEEQLRKVEKPVTVAVMGCIVNGPGEAREADIGVAGGKGRAAIFRKGKVVRSIDEADLLPVLMEEIEAVAREK